VNVAFAAPVPAGLPATLVIGMAVPIAVAPASSQVHFQILI
jgi:hypothetical protein